MWLFYIIVLLVVFYLLDKYTPKYKPKVKDLNVKEKISLKKEVYIDNSKINNININDKFKKSVEFVNEFVYSYLYVNFINKEDNTYSIVEGYTEEFEKSFFVNELIKFSIVKGIKINIPDECLISFEEFNTHSIYNVWTEIYWETEHKVYQFEFGLSQDLDYSDMAVIDSVIVLLDSENTVIDITIKENSKLGGIPKLKHLTADGAFSLNTPLYFENDFDLKNSQNFRIINEQFNDALYCYYKDSKII
ncbi:hypothetical protein [Polaribacter sp. IC073]|uniref:hypothetical protein n=1 Tax=Polaribacter sp. IC073 TaxID=2508540 RepID=UPI0011BE2AD8|nr:hypothetical protein [Polaribacter sp. IC073]TXD46046.1 hypothetical protein ES045_15200 [Polaribacter sp. IC073]